MTFQRKWYSNGFVWLAILTNVLVLLQVWRGELSAYDVLFIYWVQALVLAVPFVWFQYKQRKASYPDIVFPWEKRLYHKPHLIGMFGAIFCLLMLASVPFFYSWKPITPASVAYGLLFAAVEVLLIIREPEENPLVPYFIPRLLPLLALSALYLEIAQDSGVSLLTISGWSLLIVITLKAAIEIGFAQKERNPGKQG